MNLEQAKEKAKFHVEGAKTLCVTSDGSIFVDNDIKAMRGHAEANKLDIFVLKGEEIKAKDEKPEVVEDSKKKKKQSKNR